MGVIELRTSKYHKAVPHEPFLAPNKILGLDTELPFSILEYPQYVSTKYNGVRGCTLNGEILSRRMKPLNMSGIVQDEFISVAEWAHENRMVLDGEFHSYTYNTVGETMSILAGTIPMPDDFMFKVFYCLPYDVWNEIIHAPAKEWCFHENNSLIIPHKRVMLVTQKTVHDYEEVSDMIDSIRFSNKEGLMFLDPRSYYKCGRATIAEATLLKFKFYSSPIDAQIVNLTSRRERLEDVPTKYNSGTGKAEQVHTQDSFKETSVAGCMVCKNEEGEIVNVPFPVNTPLSLRELYYTSFNKGGEFDLKGKWISYRRLACEDRDKPIAIKDVQFRD